MTSQTSEILLLDDRIELLHSLPLSSYLEPRGIDIRPPSSGGCTGLYRGYIGLWEVFDGSLFLIGLLDVENHPINPATAFGGRQFPIHADWYSGRLEVDRGECLYRYQRGWGGDYAERLRLYVEYGRVVARRRYDQRKRLVRRYTAELKDHYEYLQGSVTRYDIEVESLQGYTVAGLKVIGQQAADDAEVWPDGMVAEEIAQWVTPMLAHCVRPGGPSAKPVDAKHPSHFLPPSGGD